MNAPRQSSPTVPTDGQTDADVLAQRQDIWRRRPLTREIYRRYFENMKKEMTTGGVNIELGGGSGFSREFMAELVTTDIVITPFVDLVADAMRLPLPDGSVDNYLMLDVVHHLPQPERFFREVVRTLRPGGRLIMTEPYISVFSSLVFKAAHPEPVDMRADPLPADGRAVFDCTGPFASNQAIPTLLFGKHRERFTAMFPQLTLRTRKLDSSFVYPLSGGFSGPCLIPQFAQGAAWIVEAMTIPLRRWMAFRILITLERTA